MSGKYALTHKQYNIDHPPWVVNMDKFPYHSWFDDKEYPVMARFLGPKYLAQPSTGLAYQGWIARLTADAMVLIFSEDGQFYEFIQLPLGTTEISATVDQAARIVLVYVNEGITYIYRYDPISEGYISHVLGTDYVSPKVLLDYPSALDSGVSDVSCFYVRNDNLYYRVQSENYQNEYLLKENCNPIVKIAYVDLWRLQIELDYTKSGIDVKKVFPEALRNLNTNSGDCNCG